MADRNKNQTGHNPLGVGYYTPTTIFSMMPLGKYDFSKIANIRSEKKNNFENSWRA